MSKSLVTSTLLNLELFDWGKCFDLVSCVLRIFVAFADAGQ